MRVAGRRGERRVAGRREGVTLPVLDSVGVESGLGDELSQPPDIHSHLLFRKPNSTFAQQAHVFRQASEPTSESAYVRRREAT
jgi:hypothetical protein